MTQPISLPELNPQADVEGSASGDRVVMHIHAAGRDELAGSRLGEAV